MRRFAAFAIAVVALPIAGGAAAGETADVHVSSQWITVTGPSLSTVTDVAPAPGETPATIVRSKIAFTVLNKSARSIWVAVKITPPAPEPDCPRGAGFLDRGRSMEFMCTPLRVVAERDYRLDVSVFADSARRDTLGQASTVFRFDQDTVDLLDQQLAARRQQLEGTGVGRVDDLDDMSRRVYVFSISGGAVFPQGDYADRFESGGMGTVSLGIMGRELGARLLSGNIDPGTRNATNAAYSARVGAPIKVNASIVPIELQGTATLPSRGSRLGALLAAGIGLHLRTVRLDNTDEHLDDDDLFGFSVGGGFRYVAARLSGSGKALSVGLDGFYRGTGSDRYVTAEMEVGFLW